MSNYNDLSGQPRKQRREDGVKLYVGGVGEDCEDDELRVVFAPHGDVLDIWCAQTPDAACTVNRTVNCALHVLLSGKSGVGCVGSGVQCSIGVRRSNMPCVGGPWY